jgi:iron-sulfur cluster repair protein YtfE (RIC family)
MDALQLLTNDHNKVRELFRQFNGGGGLTGLVRRTVGDVSASERRNAVDKVSKELETHTRVEEEIFYPAVVALGDRDLKRQVDEALREHATVKQEVSRLRKTRQEQGDLDTRMSQLEKDVEHHAKEEEKEMFPRLERLMSDDERQELGRRIQALKRRRTATTGSVGSRRGRATNTARARSTGRSTRGKATSASKAMSRSKKRRTATKARSTRRR